MLEVVVFNFRLTHSGAVVGNDDKLGLAATQGAQGLLVSQLVLARLHHQLEVGVDIGFLSFFLGHGCFSGLWGVLRNRYYRLPRMVGERM